MAEESLQNIQSLESGGPKASQLLPMEISKESDIGQFTSTVISLIERQVGFQVRDLSPDLSNVPAENIYGDLPAAVAITKDGSWVVSGYKDRVSADTVTLVEVGHVSDIKNGNVIYDKHLKIYHRSDASAQSKGQVSYIDKTGAEESGVIVENLGNWSKPGEKAFLSFHGNPPGVKRAKISGAAQKFSQFAWNRIHGTPSLWQDRIIDKISKSDLVNKARFQDAGRAIPQALGFFIDNLPDKSEFEPTKSRSVVSEVVQRNKAFKYTPEPAS